MSIGRSGETDIDLEVHLEVVIPDLALDVARVLAQAAHERCPYSRATRGNITVTVDVVDD